jgi:hypothetical protein
LRGLVLVEFDSIISNQVCLSNVATPRGDENLVCARTRLHALRPSFWIPTNSHINLQKKKALGRRRWERKRGEEEVGRGYCGEKFTIAKSLTLEKRKV